MLLGTLGASLLGNLLKDKGTLIAGEDMIRADQNFHPLTNFEIQKYHQHEPKFNGVYLRNNLHKIKDGAYVINLDEFKSIGTYQIALYVNINNGRISYDTIYFDSFGVTHIPKEIKKIIESKIVVTNIYRIKYFQ